MQTPATRRSDPIRDPLVEVRRALLRLHKALIDAERVVFERREGALANAAFLSALLEEPFFQWLRPYSRLIAEMDEAIFSREPVEPAHARALVADVHALLSPAAGGDAAEPLSREADPLGDAIRRDPAVLVAHVEVGRRAAAALIAYDDGGSGLLSPSAG